MNVNSRWTSFSVIDARFDEVLDGGCALSAVADARNFEKCKVGNVEKGKKNKEEEDDTLGEKRRKLD